MSLSQEKLLALMAFADGELVADEQAGVEALLAKSEEARRVVAAMRGEAPARAVETWLASRGVAASESVPNGPNANPHPADGIADAVMARIEREQPVVASLSAAREKRAARVRLASAGGALLMALAAGVALYVSSSGANHDNHAKIVGENTPGRSTTVEAQPDVPPSPLAVTGPTTASTTPLVTPAPDGTTNSNPPPIQVAQESDGVEVHEVESPHDVSVIYLPPAVGAAAGMTPTSVVVWLGEGSGGTR